MLSFIGTRIGSWEERPQSWQGASDPVGKPAGAMLR